MAALWKLPLVFVCENNGWAISVPVSASQSTPDIADRAKGFGIASAVVDGNDVLAVKKVVAEAAARARSGAGPSLIEAKTVRWERHSAFSSGKYANPEEAQRWKKVDPIPRTARWLSQAGLSATELDAADTQAAAIVGEAVRFAVESPFPDSVEEGIFAASLHLSEKTTR